MNRGAVPPRALKYDPFRTRGTAVNRFIYIGAVNVVTNSLFDSGAYPERKDFFDG